MIAIYQSVIRAAAVGLAGLLISLTLFSANLQAEIEIHEFDDPNTRARFLQLSDELRCPKCQNTNLSGSNAPIAKDLRTQLIRLLKEGKSDQQIEQYMLDRYGDFVLYRPQLKSSTWVLWFGPLILFLFGLVIIGRIIIGRKELSADNDLATNSMGSPVTLTSTEQDRISKLTASTPTDTNKTEDLSI